MKRKSQRTGSRPRRAGLLALSTSIFLALPGLAASDTDVDIIKATEVRIEKDMITIVGEAVVTMRNITDKKDPNYPRAQLFGRPASISRVKADKATFVIVRPKNDANFWQECLDAAKALKVGKPINRLAFYQPEVVIRGNLVVSIHGPGFVMPIVEEK